jgi:hypothetical protein
MFRSRTLALNVAAVFLTPLVGSLFQFSKPVSALAASSSAAAKTAELAKDYTSALLVVDHFLQAWQSGDAENGMALLSSRAKKAATTDGIERFFSNPEPSAYEIGRGKLLKRGRYEFPVVLVGNVNNHHSRRRFSSIIVLHSGGNDWVVDKLP